MRRIARTGWTGIALLAVALAGCADEGGELRDMTEARRIAFERARDSMRLADSLRRDSIARARADSLAASDVPPIPTFLGDAGGGDTNGEDEADAPEDTTPAADDESSPSAGGQQDDRWTAATVRGGSELRGNARLVGVRYARNEGFDRVVFEFAADRSIPRYEVEYVDRPIRHCGSGDVTRIAGDGWLQVRLRGTQAHDDEGNPTAGPRRRSSGLPVVREMEMTCDFEGIVEWVLGVSSPNRFRVIELRNPARLVVDVRQ